MESKNKLRSTDNKRTVQTIIIMFVLIFCLCLYCTYICMDYITAKNIEKLSYDEIVNLINAMTKPNPTLPITLDVILTVLKYQITKLWWLYCLFGFGMWMMLQNNRDDYKGMEHGSASWADKYDIKSFKDNTGIPVGMDFYVTVENNDGKSYKTHNLNEIVIGGSGAGKTVRKIQPDIMQMYGSYVVTDPKGELYRNMAKQLTESGYKIRVLNLININFSNSYNPFKYMNEEQDVVNVADLFMKNSAGEEEKEDFWVGAAQDLLVAIMVYLWKTEHELKTFGRVIRLVNSVRYKKGKIDPLCELARCLKNHAIDYPMNVASINWSSIQGTPEETLGSICKTLATRLRLWAIEAVDELTSNDEMDFDNIGVEKTAVFVIIPAARQTFKSIANIFFSQLFERLMYVANTKYNGKLPLLVSCEIDEFANIGKLPNFQETLSVVRSHNIRICMVFQGLSQLKERYEKSWESIVGNCSIFTFLGTNDMDSKEYVSKKLGKTTVRVDSRSYNRGKDGGGSDSQNYTARELLMPDEIPQALRPKGKSRKVGGSAIIFVDEYKPFFIPKFDTLSHPLIDNVGLSFRTNDIMNKTNIEESYKVIKLNRSNNHKQALIDFFAISQEKKEQDIAEIEAEQQAAELDEQAALAHEFDDSDFSDEIVDDLDLENEIENEISQDVNPLLAKINKGGEN